jgi:hypothetical protein
VPPLRIDLAKFPAPDAIVAVAAKALAILSPRTHIDLDEKSAVEESGDQWAVLLRTQRVGCFIVVDSRECIEMGIKGLGELRTLEVASRDVVGAAIVIRVRFGPGVPVELVATFEGVDDRVEAARAAVRDALESR